MSKPLKIYYAHCQATYDTLGETLDLRLLDTVFGFGTIIVNPNSSPHKDMAREMRANGRSSSEIMDYFVRVVEDCDGLVFRGLPEDNSIPAGVHKEILTMMAKGGFILELPSIPIPENRKILTVDETRAYIRKIKGG